MAGVVLKNENGTEVEYSDVKQIEVLYKNNDDSVFNAKYTLMSQINAYTFINAKEVNYVKITGRVSKLATGEFFMVSFGEKDCKELGQLAETKHDGVVVDSEYNIVIMFTLKKLAVGETYYLPDLVS